MVNITQLLNYSPAMIALVLALTGISYIYRDIVKDYFRLRLKIKNDILQNHLGSMGAIDIIEGKYHLLARQLISIAYATSKNIDRSNADIDAEKMVLRDLKTGMSEVFSRTIQSLHHYKLNQSGERLDLHLRYLSEVEKLEFYAPIVVEVVNSENREAIRNVILEQTDDLISNALQKIFKE